jgi:Uma2 family endonuclease
MSAALKIEWPRMTADAFLDWDGGGHQGKLELVDGVVRAMAPPANTLGVIHGNVTYLIGSILRARNIPCRLLVGAGVTPRFDAKHNVRVPDLTVTCEPPAKGQKLVGLPVLIVEILSPGNEPDTWESIRAASTIPSLQEVLVISSVRQEVRVWRRTDGDWPPDTATLTTGDAHLASIDAVLPLADIYRATVL